MQERFRQADHGPADSSPKVRIQHTSPSTLFRNAVRELRKRRGWRIADLAARAGLNRTAMVRIERGTRNVSLDEAVAIAASLGVNPVHLLAPPHCPDVKVAPDDTVPAHHYRAWLRGNGWVRPDDVEYMPAEVDVDAWTKRLDTSVKLLFHRHRALLEALEPFIDAGGEEAVAAAVACFEAAQQSLDEFALAFADRHDPRPVLRHRVRRDAA